MKNQKFDSFDGVCFLNGLVFYAPVALLIRTQAGVSESAFFILQALLSCIIFLGEIPTGMITDRIGYRRSLIVTQMLMIVARCCIFLAYRKHSMVLFVIEVFVEGIAACLSSGTDSAYLYEIYGEEAYLKKTAHSSNYGTAGFIISTIFYVVLYRFAGMEGLILATMVTSVGGFAFSLFLQKGKESKEQKCKDVETLHEKKSQTQVIRNLKVLLHCKKVFAYMGMLSLISVGWILINFFYVDKLMQYKLPVEWMSAIILVYSLLQMLGEPILERSKDMSKQKATIVFSMITGICMIVFALFDSVVIAFLCMLILPLLLTLPEYYVMEQENQLIDAVNQGSNRAAALSMLNMGVNVVEIVALFASAFLSAMGVGWCFGIVGILIVAVAFVFTRCCR